MEIKCFKALLKIQFGAEPFELIGNDTLGKIFEDLEMDIKLPTEATTNYKFPVGEFFDILSSMGPTDEPDGHTFEITVTDQNGKTASGKLSVIVTE